MNALMLGNCVINTGIGANPFEGFVLMLDGFVLTLDGAVLTL